MANLALATYLASQNHVVHLVSHRVADELGRMPNVKIHKVAKPAGSYVFGEPLLDYVGKFWASRVVRDGGHVITNGGNCSAGETNWVHYVHASYTGPRGGRGLRRLAGRAWHRVCLKRERFALRRARVIIANSERTRRDVTEHLGVSPSAVHVVYYGTDSTRFRPRSRAECRNARARLGWAADTPVIAFIGAARDERKGLCTVLDAWNRLCADPAWDADIVVIGDPSGFEEVRDGAEDWHAGHRIKMLGFRNDVGDVLAACDGVVSPVRYEAYGLGVHEALCSGLPAIVTHSAGVAERYPPELQCLLLDDPKSVGELCEKLSRWRRDLAMLKALTFELSASLRAETWTMMSARIVTLIENR